MMAIEKMKQFTRNWIKSSHNRSQKRRTYTLIKKIFYINYVTKSTQLWLHGRKWSSDRAVAAESLGNGYPGKDYDLGE